MAELCVMILAASARLQVDPGTSLPAHWCASQSCESNMHHESLGSTPAYTRTLPSAVGVGVGCLNALRTPSLVRQPACLSKPEAWVSDKAVGIECACVWGLSGWKSLAQRSRAV